MRMLMVTLTYLGFAGSLGNALQAAELPSLSATDQARLGTLLTQIARHHLPTTYTDERHWGGQKERWAGLRFERDGWKLETRRRRKAVNHGDWYRFETRLADPQRDFEVRVLRLASLPEGGVRSEFEILTHVKLHGRYARWNHGVQLLNVSIDAHATIRLQVTAKLDLALDFSHLPPDVLFEPQVEKTDVTLEAFEVDRISKLGGDVSEVLGRAVHRRLQEEIDQRQDRLVDKLNRTLTKRQDAFRVSLHDYLQSEWSQRVGLPTGASATESPANGVSRPSPSVELPLSRPQTSEPSASAATADTET